MEEMHNRVVFVVLPWKKYITGLLYVILPWKKYITGLLLSFFHGRNT